MPLPGQGLNYSPSSLLPVFNVGILGSVQAAYNAAYGAGGGTVFIPAGTWSLGSNTTGIDLDGTVPILFQGVAPNGYQNGTILTYAGSGWAFHSTASSYPPNQEQGHYAAWQDLQIECTGSTYSGAIFANYLPIEIRGKVVLTGDATNSPHRGIGLQLTPSLNQLMSRVENLGVQFVHQGMLLESDHFTAQILDFVDCDNCAIQVGQSLGPVAGISIDMLHVGLNFGAGAAGIVFQEKAYGRINVYHFEGSAALRPVAYAVSGAPIVKIGVFFGNNLHSSPDLGSPAQPAYEHMDDNVDFAPDGFSVTTPSVPGGTGSGNKIQNTTGTPVLIHLDATSAGVHVIDWLGNDKALPRTAAGAVSVVTIRHGEYIYFATAAPASWLWERLN